jgi:hypothetical protein
MAGAGAGAGARTVRVYSRQYLRRIVYMYIWVLSVFYKSI